MKKSAFLLFSSSLLMVVAFGQSSSTSSASQPAAASEPVIVIRTGTLIDGKSSQPLRNQTIVIRGNRIVSVDSDGQVPAGAKTIDLASATVLPGLIDAHTHIFLQGEDPAEGGYDIQLLKYPQSFRAARATVSARRCLEQGFTTI